MSVQVRTTEKPVQAIVLRGQASWTSVLLAAGTRTHEEFLFQHGYTDSHGNDKQSCDAIISAQDVADYARALLAFAIQEGAS